MEAFLGSVWFALMVGCMGYIVGNLFPIKFFIKDKW
jgi:hypothetical protein